MKNNNQNPAFPFIEEFFLSLLLIDSNCFFLDRHLKSQGKKIQNNKFDSNLMVNRIIFRDLSELSSLRYSTGVFKIEKSNQYLIAIKNQIHRNYMSSLADGFELFETYLKDISALTLSLNNNLINHIKPSDYKNYDKTPLNSNDFQDWRIFVKCSLKSSKKYLRFLKKTCPKLADTEKNNILKIDLYDWANTLADIRHAIIHHNPLKKKKILDWTQKRRKILTDFFPGTFDDNNYHLQLNYPNIKDNLTLLSAYSFLIFKFWSEAENHDWEQFETIDLDPTGK